jgi:signal transduction histidine kinase
MGENSQLEIDHLTQEIIRLEGDCREARMAAKRQEKTFRFLQLLHQEISAAREIQTIYDSTVRSLAVNVGFDRTVIFKLVEGVVLPVATWGYSDRGAIDRLANPIFMAQLKPNLGMLVNGKSNSAYSADYEAQLEAKYFLVLPFVAQDCQHWLFVGNRMENSVKRPTLTKTDLEMLELLAGQIAVSINQVDLYARTQVAARAAQQNSEELSQMLQQLQQTQAQLVQAEKISQLGQLVAGVAHEVNNPVSFVSGNLDHATVYLRDLMAHLGLYQAGRDRAAIEDHAEEIDLEFVLADFPKMITSMHAGVERIREIMQSLRNYSRTDSDCAQWVDLHEGLETTLMILGPRLKANHLRSKIEIVRDYGDLPRVECYSGQFNQVLMNLLANGIDAIEEVQIERPCITVRTSLEGEWVRVEIADNGPGMPESVREKLFEAFFTTKPEGKGTGLGLSISHQIIVEKHGGRLECSSVLGEGTAFCILIPVRQGQG